jgi:hypothetical protein
LPTIKVSGQGHWLIIAKQIKLLPGSCPAVKWSSVAWLPPSSLSGSACGGVNAVKLMGLLWRGQHRHVNWVCGNGSAPSGRHALLLLAFVPWSSCIWSGHVVSFDRGPTVIESLHQHVARLEP